MSTPAQFTDEQILEQLLAAEQRQPLQPGQQTQQQPPPLPQQAAAKVKIGDKEFAPTDVQGIQAAIQEQQDEFRRMQALLAEQTQVTAPPVQQQAPPQQQAQAQPRAATKKKSWTPDLLAEELKSRNTPEVFDEMLGHFLGVDSLADTLRGLAQKQILQEQAFLKIASGVDELGNRISQESKDRASENFLTNHEDYLPTPENMQMIDNYLKKDNLQWTANGLHLAYLHAKSDNMLKLKAAEAQQAQQPSHAQALSQQPQGVTAQPSLRTGATALNTESAILDRFNDLSLEQQRQFIDSFGGL